jgi:hypothetical protein
MADEHDSEEFYNVTTLYNELMKGWDATSNDPIPIDPALQTPPAVLPAFAPNQPAEDLAKIDPNALKDGEVTEF